MELEFSGTCDWQTSDKIGSYSKTVIILFVCEIILALVLLFIPGVSRYINSGDYYSIGICDSHVCVERHLLCDDGEAGIRYALTGTATGIISMLGYLPILI